MFVRLCIYIETDTNMHITLRIWQPLQGTCSVHCMALHGAFGSEIHQSHSKAPGEPDLFTLAWNFSIICTKFGGSTWMLT